MESSASNPPGGEWEKVKNLVLAAQDEAPDDVDTWLASHCPSDSTRREASRILHAAAAAGAGDFLERPASQKHLGLRPPHPARIGRYRIVDELGSGGLGVVYSAYDDLLKRPVALKVLLSPESTSSELRKRLLWDARAACSLQHPNIVVVHDIGEDQGLDYIVMERVHGSTLTACLPPDGMEPDRVVAIALQIASGLEAAHAAGIVHRDLKPTNIMISAGDSVKILDFGLAKPSAGLLPDSQTPLTIEGRFAGTVAYVAPEQAEGQGVDARADIFSFGCVLFELLAGRQAFEGKSAMSVVAKILHQEPPEVMSLVHGLDPRLGEIVSRCLRKNPDDRFQTVTELSARLSECAPPVRSGGSRITRRWSGGLGWTGWAAAAGAVLLAAALSWLAASRFHNRSAQRPYLLTRLAAAGGLTEYPALSPDGRFVAFASDRAGHGNLDIWVQPAEGSDPVQLTFGPANEYQPVFSPDGTQVVFRSEESGGGLYTVSALGGKPRLLAFGGRDPNFSPDGKWLAFWVGNPGASLLAGSAQAFVIPASGGAARPIASSLEASNSPVWDPGGQSLICVGRGKGTREIGWWIAEFNRQSVRPTTLNSYMLSLGLREPQGSEWMRPIAWLPDRTLLISAKQGDSNNIWGIRVAGDGTALDAPRRWTGGTALELHANGVVAADGRLRLAYDALHVNTSVRSVALTPAGAQAGSPQVLLGEYANIGSPSLSADGSKLAFSSRQPDRLFIRVMDLGSRQTVTVATISGSRFARPILSGDGRTLAYWAANTGYLIWATGGVPETVCTHCGPPTDVAFDGSAALFEPGDVTNQLLLCARQAEPRRVARIVDAPSMYVSAGRWSPDRRWILFCGVQNRRKTIYLAPAAPDGAARTSQLVAVSGEGYDAWEPAWSRDGRHVYFVARTDGFGCIWGRDIDPATGRPTGAAFPVAHFHQAREMVQGSVANLGEIGLSVARQFLVFSVTETTGEAWLQTLPSLGGR
jgi:Tol biopolymer transport system component